MNAIKIFHIPHKDRFLTLLEHCCGSVQLYLPDQTLCDLKEDHTARQLFRIMDPDTQGLYLLFSDSRDLLACMQYMTGAPMPS